MKFTLFLSLLILTTHAWATGRRSKPYKIVILADQAATASANQYREYLMNKRPFSRMAAADLVIEVQTIPAAEMACTNPGTVNDRLISCNKDKLRRYQRDADANLAVAFTSTATGGAGGEIPVATSNFTQYPLPTMFHEMLHNFGFADEYDYETEEEYSRYCDPPRSSPNVAHFNDVPPYADDGAARSRHTRDVPWMGRINGSTLITTGTDLGTSTLETLPVGAQVIGLFRGGPCSLHRKSWRPYQQSIMNDFGDDTIYPLYENVIIDRIKRGIGRDPVLSPPPQPVAVTRNKTPDCPPENQTFIAAKEFGDSGLRIVKHMNLPAVSEVIEKYEEDYGKGSEEVIKARIQLRKVKNKESSGDAKGSPDPREILFSKESD